MKRRILKGVDLALKQKWIILLLVVAAIFQLGMMVPYAFYQCRNGMCGNWFPNGSAAHDDSWTMAIATVSFKSFPFSLPLYSGTVLQGYHFLSAFIIYVASLSGISMHFIFYGALPFIWFCLITRILLSLQQVISKSAIFKFIFIFLFFFGGSFSYLMALYHRLPIFYPYIMTGRQAVDYFQSLPLAISIIPFLLAIYYLYVSKRLPLSKRVFYLIGIVFSAWGSKFYGGVAVASLLFTYEFIKFMKEKKRADLILLVAIILTSCISVLLIYNPLGNLGGSKSTFIFSPFAIAHSLIEEKNLIYLPNLTLARYSLQSNGWGPRLFAIEIFTWILYIFYTFGIRIIGLIYLIVQLIQKKLSIIDFSLITSVIICLIGGTMFIQRVEWWNTAQFLDYPKIILSLYAALGISQLLERKRRYVKVIFISLIVLLSIHNSLMGFIERFTYKSAVVLSKNQLDALAFLKKLPEGNVFTLPFDRFRKTTSINVEDIIDTVYVPVYTEKEMYYSTPYILDLTNVNYSKRKKAVDTYLYYTPHLIQADYFYLNKSNEFYNKTKLDPAYFTQIFENNNVEILRRRN